MRTLSKISGVAAIRIRTPKRTNTANSITNGSPTPTSTLRRAFPDGRPTAAGSTSPGASPIRSSRIRPADAYDRPSYEGGGSTTTYPFETWFYRHLDNVGDGIEIEFVDPTGTGEYRIARDANEKDALADGSRCRFDDVRGIGPGEQGRPYFRHQQARQSIISVSRTRCSPDGDQERSFAPPAVKFSDLQSSLTDSGVMDNNPLAFDLRVDFFRQSDDRVITAFTVQTSNKELKFERVGGLQTATMNIFGRITAVSGKRSGIFEDSVVANATSTELADAGTEIGLSKSDCPDAPGTYKVDVVVRDVGTGNKGIVNLGFVVPRYDEKKLSTSSLVLTSKLRTTNERDIGQMFVIGNAKVIPNLSGVYKQGEEVGIYLQVYNSGIDQTTLRPAVDVTYIL